MVVVSPEGGDIAGCFVAVSVAYELIQTPDPTPFDNDINILDSVFKGLSTLRPGLVTGQRQFDFSHLVIESVLSGGFDLESESNDGGKSSKKSKGFFRRKKTGKLLSIINYYEFYPFYTLQIPSKSLKK